MSDISDKTLSDHNLKNLNHKIKRINEDHLDIEKIIYSTQFDFSDKTIDDVIQKLETDYAINKDNFAKLKPKTHQIDNFTLCCLDESEHFRIYSTKATIDYLKKLKQKKLNNTNCAQFTQKVPETQLKNKKTLKVKPVDKSTYSLLLNKNSHPSISNKLSVDEFISNSEKKSSYTQTSNDELIDNSQKTSSSTSTSNDKFIGKFPKTSSSILLSNNEFTGNSQKTSSLLKSNEAFHSVTPKLSLSKLANDESKDKSKKVLPSNGNAKKSSKSSSLISIFDQFTDSSLPEKSSRGRIIKRKNDNECLLGEKKLKLLDYYINNNRKGTTYINFPRKIINDVNVKNASATNTSTGTSITVNQNGKNQSTICKPILPVVNQGSFPRISYKPSPKSLLIKNQCYSILKPAVIKKPNSSEINNSNKTATTTTSKNDDNMSSDKNNSITTNPHIISTSKIIDHPKNSNLKNYLKDSIGTTTANADGVAQALKTVPITSRIINIKNNLDLKNSPNTLEPAVRFQRLTPFGWRNYLKLEKSNKIIEIPLFGKEKDEILFVKTDQNGNLWLMKKAEFNNKELCSANNSFFCKDEENGLILPLVCYRKIQNEELKIFEDDNLSKCLRETAILKYVSNSKINEHGQFIQSEFRPLIGEKKLKTVKERRQHSILFKKLYNECYQKYNQHQMQLSKEKILSENFLPNYFEKKFLLSNECKKQTSSKNLKNVAKNGKVLFYSKGKLKTITRLNTNGLNCELEKTQN